MKRIHIYFFILFALFSCSIGTPPEEPQLPLDSLREGDIVLRRGRSFSSNLILSQASEGGYSHIGLLHKSDSGWCVIHAVNDEPDFRNDFDRVKIEKIERFFAPSRAKAGEILHSWVSDSLAAIINQKALVLVKDSVRFDSSFDTADSSELYCTELIFHLYKSIGEDITEGRRTKVGIMCFPDEIIFPNDISSNKKLKSFFIY